MGIADKTILIKLIESTLKVSFYNSEIATFIEKFSSFKKNWTSEIYYEKKKFLLNSFFLNSYTETFYKDYFSFLFYYYKSENNTFFYNENFITNVSTQIKVENFFFKKNKFFYDVEINPSFVDLFSKLKKQNYNELWICFCSSKKNPFFYFFSNYHFDKNFNMNFFFNSDINKKLTFKHKAEEIIDNFDASLASQKAQRLKEIFSVLKNKNYAVWTNSEINQIATEWVRFNANNIINLAPLQFNEISQKNCYIFTKNQDYIKWNGWQATTKNADQLPVIKEEDYELFIKALNFCKNSNIEQIFSKYKLNQISIERDLFVVKKHSSIETTHYIELKEINAKLTLELLSDQTIKDRLFSNFFLELQLRKHFLKGFKINKK